MPSFTGEERQLLHESLQDYFSNRYSFEHFRALSDPEHTDGFGRAEWAEYAELGWLGVALPDYAGGSAGGMTESGIVMAAAGGALSMEPFVSTLVLGASASELAGNAEQRKVLTDVAIGAHTLAFCHTEPDAGYARDYVTSVARRAGADFILSGEKTFALHADAADSLVVSARIGDENGPIGLFLVSPSAAGVHLKPAPAFDARRGAAVSLTEVALSASAKLGDNDVDLTDVIDTVLDRGALAVCAEAVGAMTTVTEQTVEYLKTREQFGQPLAKFQVLQHRLVDMSIAVEEARAATHSALTAMDAGTPDCQTIVWRAKVQCAQSARFVGGQAIQLHGGMGMTDELAIGHYYKRLTMCETAFGDAQWYLKQLAAKAA